MDAIETRLRGDGFKSNAIERELADLDRGDRAREYTEVIRGYLERKLRRQGQ